MNADDIVNLIEQLILVRIKEQQQDPGDSSCYYEMKAQEIKSNLRKALE